MSVQAWPWSCTRLIPTGACSLLLMSRTLKTVKSNPLAGRIKKVMQTDEDVGKIAQGTPILLGRFSACILMPKTRNSIKKFILQPGLRSCFLANSVKALLQLRPAVRLVQRLPVTCKCCQDFFGACKLRQCMAMIVTLYRCC